MRGLVRASALILGWLLLLGATALLAGFVWFAAQIPRAEGEAAAADAIVALTGGAHRVQDAFTLLAEGRGRRLLVSGVHPATSRQDLGRLFGEDRLIACCVDLGREAQNTRGNATETREWAARHGFRSVIVVTSSYHMPRSLAELSRAMPGITLIPHPVAGQGGESMRWWESGSAARLVISEYLKYLAVQVQHGLERASDPARPRATS